MYVWSICKFLLIQMKLDYDNHWYDDPSFPFLNLILVFTSRQHNVGHLHRKKVGENKIVLMWSIYTQMGVILDVHTRSGNNIYYQNCFKLFQTKLFSKICKLRHKDSSNKHRHLQRTAYNLSATKIQHSHWLTDSSTQLWLAVEKQTNL